VVEKNRQRLLTSLVVDAKIIKMWEVWKVSANECSKRKRSKSDILLPTKRMLKNLGCIFKV
jgi:hypothetical protein